VNKKEKICNKNIRTTLYEKKMTDLFFLFLFFFFLFFTSLKKGEKT